MSIIFIVFGTICDAIKISWAGFVLSKLWFWFIVPTFALPSLSFATAAGIYLIVSVLVLKTETRNTSKEDSWEDLAVKATSSTLQFLFVSGIILLYGFFLVCSI